MKFLWSTTYHHIRIYIESKKVEENAMIRAGELISFHSTFVDSLNDSLLNTLHSFNFIIDEFQISNVDVVAVPVNPADSFEEVD